MQTMKTFKHNQEHRDRYEDVQTLQGELTPPLPPTVIMGSNTADDPRPLNTSGLFSLFKFAGAAGRSAALIESCLMSLGLWPVVIMSSFSRGTQTVKGCWDYATACQTPFSLLLPPPSHRLRPN